MTTANPSKTEQQRGNRRDLHQEITDTIIQQLEKGVVPWHQPWNGGPERIVSIPRNCTTGKAYRGINILLLWTSAFNQKFSFDDWATMRQWNEKGEFIRKGEKGSRIVFYDVLEKEIDGVIKEIPYIKTSVVFNRGQTAGFHDQQYEEIKNKIPLIERIEKVETFIKNTNVIVEHEGFKAYYRPSLDKITMPWPETFINTETCTATEGYYSTLLHETVHWTGAPNRLARQGGKKFGDKGYAIEELVAELGAAFLCTELGIATADKGDHASYIAYWLEKLKDNKKCIFTAASEASKACDFMHGLQPK